MTLAAAWAEVVETCRILDMAVVYDIDIDACMIDRLWALIEWQIAAALERQKERSKS